ncbi:hypothetical protein [Photorhabdus sp. RM323S]|uniref:hypothetical protein n=1 Tax=Photorhabdus sp. RM323S TaxID=3342828 RepID=UPI0036DD4018
MKILMSSFDTKCVSYFGIDLEVPKFVRYIVADSEGTLYGYRFEPEMRLGYFDSGGDEFVELGVVEFEGESWKDSLEYVGEASTTVFCAKGE